MTSHDLLAAFDTLAEAPDGIARLRELVLQLAVRGKLVPQDPNDEPASILLESITAEKMRLVKEGKIPKPKPLPPMDEDVVPFAVPEGWVWCRLGGIVKDMQNGISKRHGSEGVNTVVLRLADIRNGRLADGDLRQIRLTDEEVKKYAAYDGDILVIRVNGSSSLVGRFVPCEHNRGWTYCDHLIRVSTVRQGVDYRYLCLMTGTSSARSHLESVTVTTAGQRTINQTGLSSLPVPLPPFPEQHRIVAKVDTLMALLDRLEAAQAERETGRAALRDSALTVLRNAPDAKAVDAAWTRIAERMDDLFANPADVVPLRQTILQLAVRGTLVPQNPNDEPACVLLERIVEEKARLVKEGNLPKPKPQLPVCKDERPFEVARGWQYARLNDLLSEDSRNGLSAKPNQEPPGIEILRISAGTARSDAVIMEEDHRFLELQEEETLMYELKPGDLLVCRFNGNLHYVGRVSIYEKYTGHRQVYPDKLIRLRVDQSLINPWYVRFAMNCQGIRSVVEKMCATTAGNIGISASSLKTVAIPIPPLEEQRRIVAKVDALMALCDAMEANLATAREAQAAFAAAALHHLDV